MSTRHYTEDELILHFYGEGRRPADTARHLEACDACRATYLSFADALERVTVPEPPERGDQYGLEVWQRIRPRLPERDLAWPMTIGGVGSYLAAAAAVVVLVAGAFVAGRVSMRPPAPTMPATAGNLANPANLGNSGNPANEARERILLSAVADHLDRSERMLTDIMNVTGRDISTEQAWADDLLTSSRLYRQDAEDIGEPLVADVLDEIERGLLEIVHTPSQINAAALDQLRRRIDAAALLFKVRVLGDELRQRQSAPAERVFPQTSPSTIS